jgi:hypothetical protein
MTKRTVYDISKRYVFMSFIVRTLEYVMNSVSEGKVLMFSVLLVLEEPHIFKMVLLLKISYQSTLIARISHESMYYFYSVSSAAVAARTYINYLLLVHVDRSEA